MKRAFVLTLAVCAVASAQGQKFRPASESDFIGYWRIQLVPNESHRSQLKNEETGYADPCQFFIHKPDGTWFNVSINNGAGVEETRRRCPGLKKADLDLTLYAIRNESPYKWKKLSQQDGYFYVGDPADKVLLWKADYVLVDIPESAALGYNFKKGDLLMQMSRRIDAKSAVPVWPMVLRPVLD